MKRCSDVIMGRCLAAVLPALAGILGTTGMSEAACVWTGNSGAAADCSMAETQACLDEASEGLSGDVTITLPACTETWDGPVTVSYSAFACPHPLQEAGSRPSAPTGLAAR
jgi:hypothetical protein